MKRKLLVAGFLLLAALLLGGAALAADDTIVCSMEVSPSTLAAPGEVSVTITISNASETDMKDPLTLYSPTSEVVSDFGENGSVTLKAGEVKTWTGKWDVNQRTLDNGQIVFFIKYFTYKANGEREAQSQPIRGKLNVTEAKSNIEIKRTISPGTARSGQAVTVRYDIANTGTVSLKNISITEHKDIAAKAVTVAEELKPGELAQVKFPVTMGKKDLTSAATITYTVGDDKAKQTQHVGEQKITYGEAALTALLTSSAPGVQINGTVTLKLVLKNSGSVDYTDIRVTDATLGDVFTNQELAAGASLTLEKEITLTQSTDYQFTVAAIDNTGTEVSLLSDAITVQAVDPNKMVQLNVIAAADHTEVYTQPGIVRFTVTVENIGEVDATDVTLYHGGVRIYTFPTIPAGESRKLTRDAALSMAGKYQFTAVSVDAMKISNTFVSNEIQIAFSVPTPAPATATPPLVPTNVPTYAAVTVPPISHASVGTVPKMIRTVFYPLMIISIILLAGSLVLLGFATKKRHEQKRASELALDHLDRAKRRDYATPGDEPQADTAVPEAKPTPKEAARPAATTAAEPGDDVELPHMKYVRNAQQRGNGTKGENYGKTGLRDAAANPSVEEDLYHTYGGDHDLPEPIPKQRANVPPAKPKDWSAYAKRPDASAKPSMEERNAAYQRRPADPYAQDGYAEAYRQTQAADQDYADDQAYDPYADYADADGYADGVTYADDTLDALTEDGYVQDPLGYNDPNGYADEQFGLDGTAYDDGGDPYTAGAGEPYPDGNATRRAKQAQPGSAGRTRRSDRR